MVCLYHDCSMHVNMPFPPIFPHLSSVSELFSVWVGCIKSHRCRAPLKQLPTSPDKYLLLHFPSDTAHSPDKGPSGSRILMGLLGGSKIAPSPSGRRSWVSSWLPRAGLGERLVTETSWGKRLWSGSPSAGFAPSIWLVCTDQSEIRVTVLELFGQVLEIRCWH